MVTQAVKKDGASRVFWGGEWGESFPVLCPFPSHLLLDLQCPVLGKDWMFVQGGLGEGGLGSPRRPGCGAGWQPGPQDSLPPALCCSGSRACSPPGNQ